MTYLVYMRMWCVLPGQNDPLTRNLYYFRHINFKKVPALYYVRTCVHAGLATGKIKKSFKISGFKCQFLNWRNDEIYVKINSNVKSETKQKDVIVS
jgi:hypothetical protein